MCDEFLCDLSSVSASIRRLYASLLIPCFQASQFCRNIYISLSGDGFVYAQAVRMMFSTHVVCCIYCLVGMYRIFASVPNSGPNNVFIFGRIVSSERIRIVSLYSAKLETSTADFT